MAQCVRCLERSGVRAHLSHKYDRLLRSKNKNRLPVRVSSIKRSRSYIAMLTPASTNPAVRIHLPGNVFVTGCPVEGEVELNVRNLQEENVQEVRIELKGVAKMYVLTLVILIASRTRSKVVLVPLATKARSPQKASS